MTTIERIAQQRILVLDGAMGTMIQRLGLTEEDFHPPYGGLEDHKILLKGNNELLSLSRPEAIKRIHEQYLEAGADIVETNTFSATSIAQAEHECSHLVREMNLASARLAKEACEAYTKKDPSKPRFDRLAGRCRATRPRRRPPPLRRSRVPHTVRSRFGPRPSPLHERPRRVRTRRHPCKPSRLRAPTEHPTAHCCSDPRPEPSHRREPRG